ncbi:specifically androgen-regulated gene protein [Leptodactylus fuscus]|uniref:specifically androgen-regulated gene protein n=1 Tax=Leptodactylus fuscus TaxID=238119 RepID=UPI003F4EFF3A
MPEKTLWTRHVGMESLNSVGSTGSCDSMESISSNHSAFSGDGYDHLSAEERECLMFLEETIDSLDNEEDSGVSNDELETTEKSTSHLETEPIKVPTSIGNDETKPASNAFPKLEEWASVAKIPQGYHSFPRIVQVSREETTKHTTDSNPPDSNLDQSKSWHGTPKSLTSINRPQMGEPQISDLLIIPPPEPFRDPQVIIDKRRSVTDPTDAREIRYDKVQLRPASIAECKEMPAVVKPIRTTTPTLLPRVSSPKASTSSQETVIQSQEKIADLKQGPPTAPKPRTLPPHIIIKSSSGVVANLEPQMRQRTFSAHDRFMPDHKEPTIPKVPHSKEQERARLEALQKLGLDVKSSSQENISVRASKTDLTLAQGVGDQIQKDVNRKSDINHQDRLDVIGTIPAQPPVINLKTDDGHVRNESLSRNRLSMKSNSLEKEEPISGKGDHVVEVSPQHSIKSTIFAGNRPSIRVIQVPNLLNEAHAVTEGSPKNSDADSVKSLSPSHSQKQPQSKADIKSDYAVKELDNGSNAPLKSPSKPDCDRKSSALITNPVEKETVIPETNPVRVRQSDNLSIGEKLKEKLGSSENIGHISTSPVKTFSFPRPKDVVDTNHNPEIIRVKRDDKVLDKSNRHSTHFEPPKEPYLHFPQGSVPGLRQINIKANTLERSGVGLSGSMSNIEKESQKSSSSFFKKPLFSGNFLRSSRPRPASLGTGKDFANLEPSATDGESTEKRFFFSRPSRSSAPVTSVKITPKGSSEEHRKEALKKLGILKE